MVFNFSQLDSNSWKMKDQYCKCFFFFPWLINQPTKNLHSILSKKSILELWKSWSKKKKKTWNHDILRNHRRIEICKNHFHHHFHSHSPIQSNLLYSNSHSSHLIVPSSGLITKSSIPSNQSYPQSQPTDNTFTPIFNLHQKKQLPVRITQNVSQVKKNKNQSNSHSRFFKNGI